MRSRAVTGAAILVALVAGTVTAVSRADDHHAQTFPSGRIALPARSTELPTGMIEGGVGMTGVLHFDGRCVYLTFAQRSVSLVWPAGWTFAPKTGLLYDPSGRISGKTGEILQGGGVVLDDATSYVRKPANACVPAASTEIFGMEQVQVDPFLTKRYPQQL